MILSGMWREDRTLACESFCRVCKVCITHWMLTHYYPLLLKPSDHVRSAPVQEIPAIKLLTLHKQLLKAGEYHSLNYVVYLWHLKWLNNTDDPAKVVTKGFSLATNLSTSITIQFNTTVNTHQNKAPWSVFCVQIGFYFRAKGSVQEALMH